MVLPNRRTMRRWHHKAHPDVGSEACIVVAVGAVAFVRKVVVEVAMVLLLEMAEANVHCRPRVRVQDPVLVLGIEMAVLVRCVEGFPTMQAGHGLLLCQIEMESLCLRIGYQMDCPVPVECGCRVVELSGPHVGQMMLDEVLWHKCYPMQLPIEHI